MKIELDDNTALTIIMIAFLAAFVLFVLFAEGCATIHRQLTYWAEHGQWVDTPTGKYQLIEASGPAVQNVWESRVSGGRKHMKVESLIDVSRMEIWYATDTGLKRELHNAQSPSNLCEAYEDDIRTAFPAIQPPESIPRTRKNR